MAMGRVEFANGIASVYDELGRRRTTKPCERLIGYGPKGFVIKYHGFYHVHDPIGCGSGRLLPMSGDLRAGNVAN